MRITLDAIFPPKHPQRDPVAAKPTFKNGDRVTARLLRNNKNIWCFGTVVKALGPRNYIVHLDDADRTIMHHHNQLRATAVPSVTHPPESDTLSSGPLSSFDVPKLGTPTVVQNQPLPAPTPAPGAATPPCPLHRSSPLRTKPQWLCGFIQT